MMQPVVKYVSFDGHCGQAQSVMPNDTIQAVEAQDTTTSPYKDAPTGEKKIRDSYRPIRHPACVDPSTGSETQGGSSGKKVMLPEDVVPIIKMNDTYFARRRRANHASKVPPQSGSIETKERFVGRKRRISRASKAPRQSASIEETWSLLSDQQTSLEPAQGRCPRRPGKRNLDGLVEDAEAFLFPTRHDSDQK